MPLFWELMNIFAKVLDVTSSSAHLNCCKKGTRIYIYGKAFT